MKLLSFQSVSLTLVLLAALGVAGADEVSTLCVYHVHIRSILKISLQSRMCVASINKLRMRLSSINKQRLRKVSRLMIVTTSASLMIAQVVQWCMHVDCRGSDVLQQWRKYYQWKVHWWNVIDK